MTVDCSRQLDRVVYCYCRRLSLSLYRCWQQSERVHHHRLICSHARGLTTNAAPARRDCARRGVDWTHYRGSKWRAPAPHGNLFLFLSLRVFTQPIRDRQDLLYTEVKR